MCKLRFMRLKMTKPGRERQSHEQGYQRVAGPEQGRREGPSRDWFSFYEVRVVTNGRSVDNKGGLEDSGEYHTGPSHSSVAAPCGGCRMGEMVRGNMLCIQVQ